MSPLVDQEAAAPTGHPNPHVFNNGHLITRETELNYEFCGWREAR
jgi:hypothetical protein